LRGSGEERGGLPLEPPPGFDPDGVVLTFRVPKEYAGLRLDRFLQNRIPRLSRTRAQEIIRACACRQDGSRRKPSEIVRAEEVVMLVRERFVEPETPLQFGILYQDEAMLAVDKPAGLPMHPTATYHKNTLSYLLRQRYASQGGRLPQIAHRLDRETSGVVICACTEQDERVLKRAFEEHRVEKTYLAIVQGRVEREQGVIDLPLCPVKEGLHVLMQVSRPGEGLQARTEFRVLERRAGHSLLELCPRSGRQHQLRVHLSAVGNPIVGDKLYGPEREEPFLEYIETGMTDRLRARLGHDRQALHAHRTALAHPRTGDAFAVTSPLAPDLADLWSRLR
jgi:23S rRNA pseudouridine1911/1915/1917 synthase